MTVSRLFLLLAVLAFAVSVASADAIDPTVIIRGTDPPPIPITNPHQTFTFTATSTILDIAFQNDTGVLLRSLSLALTGTDAFGNPLAFSFGDNPGDGIFANFNSSVNGNTTTLFFFGVDGTHTGLVPAVCSGGSGDDNSQVNQNNQGNQDGTKVKCVGGVYDIEFAGIPPGGIVHGTGTVSTVGTPEPAALFLFSAGLAGLAAFRKRRSSPQA